MINLYEEYATLDDAESLIGELSDCISCKVVEALNNSFEATLSYPIIGVLANEIAINRIIGCKPNPYDNEQLFRIYRISKPINGIFTVYAEHITYSMTAYVCFPNTEYASTYAEVGTLMEHLTSSSGLNSSVSGGYTIVFSSDITRVAEWEIASHIPMKQAMSYAINVFGGEWKFNNSQCVLMENRGEDRGVYIEYGVNMTDFVQTLDNTSQYTHVMPFWKGKDENGDDVIVYSSPQFIPLSSNELGIFKPYILDVSSAFEAEPSQQEVYDEGYYWKFQNGASLSRITANYSIEVIQRGKTSEYAHLTDADHIEIGDTVHIKNKLYGIEVSLSVVETTYDVISDRLLGVEIGTLKKSIVDTISKVESGETTISDTGEEGKVEEEIPTSITKNSANKVTAEYTDYSVIWEADGSGNTRYNFRKTIIKGEN